MFVPLSTTESHAEPSLRALLDMLWFPFLALAFWNTNMYLSTDARCFSGSPLPMAPSQMHERSAQRAHPSRPGHILCSASSLPHTFTVPLQCPSHFSPPGMSNLPRISSHSSDIPSLNTPSLFSKLCQGEFVSFPFWPYWAFLHMLP